MEKLWVFDLDDTLIDNVHDYAQPILDAVSYIIKILGSKAPHVSRIIEIEQTIDKARIDRINPATSQRFGYSMERFPGTMIEVYRVLCEQAKDFPNPKHEQRLYQIGMAAFDEKKYANNIKPGAKELLAFLHEHGDVVMILTKGDVQVQNKKLNALFTQIPDSHVRYSKIVEFEKDANSFQLLRGAAFAGFHCQSAYAVGNDYTKDIVPAFDSEFRGVFIPVETWEVLGKIEEIKDGVDKNRCLVLNSLTELQNIYKELP